MAAGTMSSILLVTLFAMCCVEVQSQAPQWNRNRWGRDRYEDPCKEESVKVTTHYNCDTWDIKEPQKPRTHRYANSYDYAYDRGYNNYYEPPPYEPAPYEPAANPGSSNLMSGGHFGSPSPGTPIDPAPAQAAPVDPAVAPKPPTPASQGPSPRLRRQVGGPGGRRPRGQGGPRVPRGPCPDKKPKTCETTMSKVLPGYIVVLKTADYGNGNLKCFMRKWPCPAVQPMDCDPPSLVETEHISDNGHQVLAKCYTCTNECLYYNMRITPNSHFDSLLLHQTDCHCSIHGRLDCSEDDMYFRQDIMQQEIEYFCGI